MKYLSLAVYLFAATATAQVAPSIDLGPPVTISHVYEFPGMSADSLYDLTDKWVVYTYRNPDVVKIGRIKGEFIRGNGLVESGVVFDSLGRRYGDIRYIFEIEVRDQRTRFTIYDIEVSRGIYDQYQPAHAYILKPNGKQRNTQPASRTILGLQKLADRLFNDYHRYISNPKTYHGW